MNSTTAPEQPTVVLVHGAFADASSWTGVIERLHSRGIKVTAPANPLRGLTSDSAYLKAILDQTPGPVIAVGHSYAGAVISGAAHGATNVVGLVFVAAFAPDEGEVLGEVAATSNDSILMAALLPQRYPSANGESATEFVADPAKFRDTFLLCEVQGLSYEDASAVLKIPVKTVSTRLFRARMRFKEAVADLIKV